MASRSGITIPLVEGIERYLRQQGDDELDFLADRIHDDRESVADAMEEVMMNMNLSFIIQREFLPEEEREVLHD